MHRRDDVDSLIGEHGSPRSAECDVEYGPILGHVDVLAGEHRIAQLLDTRSAGEVDQQREGAVVDAVLGVVDVQITNRCAVALAARGIRSEELAQMTSTDLVGVLDERGPLGQ